MMIDKRLQIYPGFHAPKKESIPNQIFQFLQHPHAFPTPAKHAVNQARNPARSSRSTLDFRLSQQMPGEAPHEFRARPFVSPAGSGSERSHEEHNGRGPSAKTGAGEAAPAGPTGLQRPVGWLMTILVACARKIQSDREARRALRVLQSMDDRTLKDIGLSRFDVSSTVAELRQARAYQDHEFR
jgi:uncharacterized protein YjiS (DUF1127 family)